MSVASLRPPVLLTDQVSNEGSHDAFLRLDNWLCPLKNNVDEMFCFVFFFHQNGFMWEKRKGCYLVHADMKSHVHALAPMLRWRRIYVREKEVKGREVRSIELYYKHRVLPAGFSKLHKPSHRPS